MTPEQAKHFRAVKFVYHVHLNRTAAALRSRRRAEIELCEVWEDIHLRNKDPYGLVRGAAQPTPTKHVDPAELPRYVQ